jgi:hypothetical protein
MDIVTLTGIATELTNACRISVNEMIFVERWIRREGIEGTPGHDFARSP